MTFYRLTPFVDSYVNSDWLELVIYCHTDESGEQNYFRVNFSDNNDLRRGFRQVCATFGIEAFQEDQKMFFEDNNVFVLLPTAYGRSLVYQATPMIDLVSPREETDHYIYCTAS